MSTSNELVIRFLNVGQGDSTHIVLPTGEHMLIDINLDRKCGGISVINYLRDQLPPAPAGKKQRLDYFVVTHPHDDHICGTGDLAETFDIGEMWHSGHELDCEPGEHPAYDEYRDLIKKLGQSARVVCAKSEPWATIGDVTFHVYRPSRKVITDRKKSDDENRNDVHNECMVLKMTYGGTAVMFTGDSHMAAWQSIVKSYDKNGQLEAAVLHASHHGSRTFFKQSCEEDEPWTDHLDAINPTHLVVSVGRDNGYGHPDGDMMDEYESRIDANNIYRTDEDLSMFLSIDEQGFLEWGARADEEFQEQYELPDDRKDDKQEDWGSSGLAKAWVAATSSKTRLKAEGISA
jgi:beta-lactamase superfamily II metal-dependent hydrolase